MYGFLAMLYNLICGSVAASDSISKYKQSQQNLKEAIDKGDKIYYDAKGRMKTIGGDPAMEWFDERRHRVIINRVSGRVIRNLDEEKEIERREQQKKWNEESREKAMKEGKPYYIIFPQEDKKFFLDDRVKDKNGNSWTVMWPRGTE